MSTFKDKTDNYPTLSRPFESMKPEYDVVVIGSGYGAGVAASRMARAGKSVAVLELGWERRCTNNSSPINIQKLDCFINANLSHSWLISAYIHTMPEGHECLRKFYKEWVHFEVSATERPYSALPACSGRWTACFHCSWYVKHKLL